MLILEIRCYTMTSIALPNQGFLVGDAMVFAAKTRALYKNAAHRTPDEWEPIQLPVRLVKESEHPFYACSSLFYKDGVKDYDVLRKGCPPFVTTAQKKTGPFRMGQIELNLLSVPYVYFFVEIENRTQSLEFGELFKYQFPGLYVGKKGNAGRGNIYKVDALPRRDMDSAIIDAKGRPLRPIPVDYAKENSIRGILTQTSLTPPYFHHPRVQAVVRSFDPIWKEEEVRNETVPVDSSI